MFCACTAAITSRGMSCTAREARGIEPDAHRVLRAEYLQVADTGQAADRILQVGDHEVGDVAARCAVGLVVDREHHQEIRVRLRDDEALLLHGLRQARQRLLHLVLHLHLRDVRIDAAVERDVDLPEVPAALELEEK